MRTRVIDDRLRRSFERDAIDCVVLLGCGLDARALRLAAPAGVEWVELDRAPVLAWKAHRLATLAQPRVRRAAVDLGDRADVERALDEVRGRAVVVLEGVLQYLAPPAVAALLRVLGQRTTWTRVLCDVGGGRWSRWFARGVARTARDAGAPYRTRIDDAARLFAEHGLPVVEQVSLATWDQAQPRPRWRRPWSASWMPSYVDAARVLEAAPANQVTTGG
ncbi:MAG: hypothetical protein NVSMB47_06750 [Polyangiales bacterium]